MKKTIYKYIYQLDQMYDFLSSLLYSLDNSEDKNDEAITYLNSCLMNTRYLDRQLHNVCRAIERKEKG